MKRTLLAAAAITAAIVPSAAWAGNYIPPTNAEIGAFALLGAAVGFLAGFTGTRGMVGPSFVFGVIGAVAGVGFLFFTAIQP